MTARLPVLLLCASCIVILAGITAHGLQEEESISSFKSAVTVDKNGTLTVTETIKVTAAGNKIKRGIYRDFPTLYRSPLRLRVNIPFKILHILKNGADEPYHVESTENGKRIYLGKEDVFLQPGVYTYTIEYTTSRQLGFTKDHTELYWNVTGNSWDFTINHTEALISLPGGASGRLISEEGFTGPVGSVQKDYRFRKSIGGTIEMTCSRPLFPGEGFTVRLRWPSGIVSPPPDEAQYAAIMEDNLGTGIGITGLLLVFFYYIVSWVIAGRDPEKGIVLPQIQPPDNLSAAAVRYIMEMGYDMKVFSAALVHMAVKGVIKISEEKGAFSLEKISDDISELPPEEKKVHGALFAQGATLKLEQSNHAVLSAAITSFKKSLSLSCEKTYFLRNLGYLIPGMILSVIALAASLFVEQRESPMAFMLLWISGWTFGLIFMIRQLINAWNTAISGKKVSGIIGSVFFTLFLVPFFIGELAGLGIYFFTGSPLLLLAWLLIAAVNLVFYSLIKAPTRAGRKVMDKIEGFKKYLEAASRQQPADTSRITRERFEEYLPYAIALGAGVQWAESFAADIAASAQSQGMYRPLWYYGRTWNYSDIGAMTDSISGSFSQAISSSSTASGSSSGGGSSGGGGGGGGGGGW